MTRPVTFRRRLQSFRKTMRTHGALVILLTFLAVVAGSSQFLKGSLLEGVTVSSQSGDASSVASLSPLRTCSATGTVFEKIWNFSVLERTFREQMTAVVKEREQLLSSPSSRSCLKDQEPEMPALRMMAKELPGWYVQEQYPVSDGTATRTTLRPVTWNTFSSIVTEFERVYECRLTEISDRALLVVSSNLDYDETGPDGRPTMFCCTEASGSGGGCVRKEEGTACSTTATANPQCDNQCSVGIDSFQIAMRLNPLVQRMDIERSHVRTALQRTLTTLRSFETNDAIARQLSCYERASVDLQNELSLLSDASSCLPRIWDVVTSLHDRKSPSN